MLKLKIIEIFLRGIPEAGLFIFAMYVFSKNSIDTKKYIVATAILAVIAYLIRLLPINYGVHTILSLISLIVLSVNINKIDTIKAIGCGIIIMVLEGLCEGVDIFFIQHILNLNISYIFSDPTLKILYGIPSLLIFALIVEGYYLISKRRKELKSI